MRRDGDADGVRIARRRRSLTVLNARADRDVAVAEQRKPIVVTRIFTGPDGKTHAEQIDVKLAPGGGSRRVVGDGEGHRPAVPSSGAELLRGLASGAAPAVRDHTERSGEVPSSTAARRSRSGRRHILLAEDRDRQGASSPRRRRRGSHLAVPSRLRIARHRACTSPKSRRSGRNSASCSCRCSRS